MGPDDKVQNPELFTVIQADYLDGELLYVGGEADVVSVHIRDEETIHKCITDRATASRLGTFVEGQPFRVFGTATWTRDETDGWQLKTFVIENFMPLERQTLQEALSHFEELPPSNWPGNFIGSKE